MSWPKAPPTYSQVCRAFLERVWRCDHTECTTCCWPWLGFVYASRSAPIAVWQKLRGTHANFYDRQRQQVITVHRFAYELDQDGQMIFPGRGVQVCHRCHFAPCCNGAHLTLGAKADNYRDQRGRIYYTFRHMWPYPSSPPSLWRPRGETPVIRLPDGRDVPFW